MTHQADNFKKLYKECNLSFRDLLVSRLWEGIVHNINSPLQVVLMNIELMKMQRSMRDDIPEDIWERITQVSDAFSDIQTIISNVSFHPQKDADPPTPVILEELLKNELDFWRGDLFFKHKIEKDVEISERQHLIMIDPVKLTDIVDAILGIQISFLRHLAEIGEDNLVLRVKEDDSSEDEINLMFDRSGPPFTLVDGMPVLEEMEEKKFVRLCLDVLKTQATGLNTAFSFDETAITIGVPKRL